MTKLESLSRLPTSGVPIGPDGWYLAIEVLRPQENASLWGQATWGTAIWNEEAWTNITNDAEGYSIRRGSDSPGQRPSTGTAVIRFTNDDGQWSPWKSIYNAPGTLFRISAYKLDGTFIPRFVGLVEIWREINQYPLKWAEVELAETISILALVDNNAGSLVGSGETAGPRVQRLLDEAEWQYGFYDETQATPGYTLQSTDMADNRLTELHLTADSTDRYFRSHRSGKAMIETQDKTYHPNSTPPNAARWGAAVWGVNQWSSAEGVDWTTVRAASYFYRRFEFRPDSGGEVLPDANGRHLLRLVYDLDSVQPFSTDEIVITEARFAKVGGTQQVAEDPVASGRWGGRRVLERNDLITQNDANVLALAQTAIARNSQRTLHIGAVTLSPEDNMPGMMTIDIGDPTTFVFPDYAAVNGFIEGITEECVAMNAAEVDIRLTVQIGTYAGAVDFAAILGD